MTRGLYAAQAYDICSTYPGNLCKGQSLLSLLILHGCGCKQLIPSITAFGSKQRSSGHQQDQVLDLP